MRLLRAALLMLFACGGGLPVPTYIQQRSAALSPVPYPPPPARAESVPGQPAHGTVWIDGEWVWRRRRWAWRQGRWVVPPSGARFSPWTMVRGDDGAIYYALGVWRAANDKEIAEPQALSTATSVGEIVNPEGERENTGPTIRSGSHDASPSVPAPADGGVGP